MGQTIVRVRTVQDSCVAVGWTGPRTLTIDRAEQAGGMGLGFNGGERLLLAIGGCYCNDLFREATKRGITIKSVHVDVEADWGGEPVRAQNVTLAPRVEAEASEAEILTLIEDTDRLAEIPQFAQAGDTCNPQRCSSCSSSKVRAAGKLMTVSV